MNIYQDFACVPSDIFLIYICPRRAGVGDGAARDGPHPDPVRRPAPSPDQPAILLPPARKKTNAETRIKLSIKQRKKSLDIREWSDIKFSGYNWC